MKRLSFVLGLLILLLVGGCGSGGDDGKVEIPFGSDDYKNENYEVLVEQLKDSGFKNIKTKAVDDLITGWLTKDGEVDKVTVSGKEEFDKMDKFDPKVKILISYHTFPEKSSKESTEITKESEPQKSESSSSTAPSSSTTISSQKSVESKPKEDPVLVVGNNAELAAMLTSPNEVDPLYSQFAEKYKDRLIEFDGCIINIEKHGNYDTRYDFLLSAGNYINADTANPGPIFQFEDVSRFDLGFEGEGLSVGNNVHILAKVISYSPDSLLFKLDPEKITLR